MITGGNGFIGSCLVRKLLSLADHSITLVSNTQNANDELLKKRQLQENLPLTFHMIDITDRKEVLELFNYERPDTCVHLAAKISVADSIRNPEETMAVNVDGTSNVLEACYKSKVKDFLFASSAAVYGDAKKLPIKESATLDPLSSYGESKMHAEKLVLEYEKANKIQNAIVLRIFNVYGKGQQSETDVISKFAGRLSKGLPPIIYGDGTQTRDFITVDDVADAFLLSIRSMQGEIDNQELQRFPVFNIGTGIPTRIGQIALKMIKIAGLELEPIYEMTEDKKEILHSYADMSKSKKILHFVPKKELDLELREIMRA